jgi:hypothetical protein
MIEVPDDKPYQEGKILFYCDWKIDYMIEGKRYNEKKIVIDSVSLNLVN